MVSRKIDPIRTVANQSTSDYLGDIDDVFDPVKLNALAKKINLTEDVILNELQTISARKENDREPFPLLNNIKFVDRKSTVEINQFYKESVDQYILGERGIEGEIEEKYLSTPSSELEEMASTLALTTDIYIDAKTGVFDVGKLTELLAKQPHIFNRGSGEYVGRIPEGEETKRHNKKMEDRLKQLIEMTKKQQTVSGDFNSITDAVITSPDIHQRNHDMTATQEGLDEANKEIVRKNTTIANMLDRDRRMRESNLTNYKLTTRYMMKVGKPTYKSYCQTTLKNKSAVNASEHLRQFRIDMRELMDDLMKELSEIITLQRPKSDSAWRTMQVSVL